MDEMCTSNIHNISEKFLSCIKYIIFVKKKIGKSSIYSFYFLQLLRYILYIIKLYITVYQILLKSIVKI